MIFLAGDESINSPFKTYGFVCIDADLVGDIE